MDVIVKHSKNWYEGGIDLDEVIEKFAEKSGLECLMNNGSPTGSGCLRFKTDSKNKITDFKRRMKRSKKIDNDDCEISVSYIL